MKEPITIAELIKWLNNFPSDMTVFAAWEGVFVPITKEDIGFNIVSPYSDKKLDAVIFHVDCD